MKNLSIQETQQVYGGINKDDNYLGTFIFTCLGGYIGFCEGVQKFAGISGAINFMTTSIKPEYIVLSYTLLGAGIGHLAYRFVEK